MASQAYANIHGYDIGHNNDVNHGLEYLEKYWNTPRVIEIFDKAKQAGRDEGYEFSHETYGYILYRDGDYKYTLRRK